MKEISQRDCRIRTLETGDRAEATLRYIRAAKAEAIALLEVNGKCDCMECDLLRERVRVFEEIQERLW